MCGIAGVYNRLNSEVNPDTIIKMGNAMRHRGPDDYGYAVFYRNQAIFFRETKTDSKLSGLYNKEYPQLMLGHRRLSIIDLSSAGRQPMSNENGSVWIVYNGEIYNFMDLKKSLKEKHNFKSHTDTEVIIHLYEERGLDCLPDLNGIFAFVIWDVGKKRLILARDRFGVKPLYYKITSKYIIFASEIKAILMVEPSVEVDLKAFSEHFTFQNNLNSHTIFKDINLIEAGHFIVIDDNRIEKRCYWDINYQEEDSRDENFYVGRLRDFFERAVKRQLVSDVPLGTYLSGGMDTGAISAIASRYFNGLHTFTCGFNTGDVSKEEKLFDERKESYDLASFLGTIHHEITLGRDAMEKVFPEVIWHLEEPRVGISYQVYYVTELISKFVTVVLSGVGGDEFFSGYPWRYESILDCQKPDIFNQRYYQCWVRLLSDEEKRNLFSDTINKQLSGFSTFDSFCSVMKNCTATLALNRAMYFDAKTFLHGILMVEDKLSMAHSIESRVPLLDNDFIDFTLTIPAEFKLKKGAIKYILKQAMRGLLPEKTLYRRKQGFTPPDKSWYKTDETLKYIKSLILSERTIERGYFKEEYLRKILEDHLSGKRNHRFLIWSLMCFEWWNRIFVDRDYLLKTYE